MYSSCDGSLWPKKGGKTGLDSRGNDWDVPRWLIQINSYCTYVGTFNCVFGGVWGNNVAGEPEATHSGWNVDRCADDGGETGPNTTNLQIGGGEYNRAR